MTGRTTTFNGRFLTAAQTGVQRVARELLTATDALLTGGEAGEAAPHWRVLAPAARSPGLARSHDLVLRHMIREDAGALPGQAWEQLYLPVRTRADLLVNLCNMAPLVHRRSITMIHDAQVFLTPQSYSAAFRAWYQVALPVIGRRSLRVLTVSNYSKTQLVRFGVAPADRIDVVPNGSDHILACPSSPEILTTLGLEAKGYAVALSNTQAHKNIKVLLQAADRPAFGGARLVLVGGAGAEDFARLGFAPPAHVVFAGRVDDAQLRALVEGAACFACPSTTEGFGLPPAEAMQLGCPVVASPEGALPETCGDAAVYAAADDPQAWAEAMGAFVGSADLRARHAALGFRQAARFRWADSARQLLDILAAQGG
jgi:glycosyltransferase involved in cell wall biosynthesis